jgi:cholesterol transport system auxiliary component
VRKLAISALFLSLAGCGSLFHSSAPAPTTYQLAVEQKPAGAPLAADLAVLAPRVRRGLDNDRIAVQYPDRRLDYLAGARWSGPLDEMLQDLTLEAFWQAGVLHTVDTDASAFESGYWLEIEVADFQAEYKDNRAAPVVHVHLVARVGRAQDRRLLGEFDAEARQPAADNRLTAVVAAYNQATDATLARVVAESTEIVRRNPETR